MDLLRKSSLPQRSHTCPGTARQGRCVRSVAVFLYISRKSNQSPWMRLLFARQARQDRVLRAFLRSRIGIDTRAHTLELGAKAHPVVHEDDQVRGLILEKEPVEEQTQHRR